MPMRRLLGPILLAALAAGTFAGTLRGPYLYDDVDEIHDNPRVHRLDSIPSLLITDFWNGERGEGILYRPLLAASTPVLFLLGGGGTLPFHLWNLLMHAATTLLLAAAGRRLLGDDRAAFAAALLFAIHPIHSEAVAWISGRSELSWAAFGAAAWLFHLTWARTRRARHAAGAGLFLAAALGFKESAVCLPLLFAATEPFVPRDAPSAPLSGEAPSRPAHRAFALRAAPYAAYGVIVAGWLAARFAVLGRLGRPAAEAVLLNPLNVSGIGWPARAFTALRVLATGLRESVIPWTGCIDYGFNQVPVAHGILAPDVLLGLGFCIAAGALLVVRRGRPRGLPERGLLAGATVFLITWLPVSSLIVPAVAIFAERYLYVPVFGVCLAAGAAWSTVRDRLRPGGRLPLAAAGAVALAALAAVTWHRNGAFSDHLSLSSRGAANCPDSARAHYMFAGFLRGLDKPREAARELERAVEIAPGYVDARADLAQVLAGLGDRAAAEREALASLASGPEGVPESLGVASALAAAGLGGRAREILDRLRTEHPDDQRILVIDAERLLRSGRAREALAVYEKIQKLHPAHPLGPTGAGRAWRALGEPAKARGAFEEALAIDPFFTEALGELASLLLDAGSSGPDDARRAAGLMERYVRLDPASAGAWFVLGAARQRAGDLDGARSAYSRSASLEPPGGRAARALERLRPGAAGGTGAPE